MFIPTVQWKWKGGRLLQWNCHKKSRAPDTTCLCRAPLNDPVHNEPQVCVRGNLPESVQSLYVWVFLKWDFIGVPWVPIGFLCLILKTPWELRSFRVWLSPTLAHIHRLACIALPSTSRSPNRHYIKGIPVGPKWASLFIHSMSDINKMTCNHSNTPFCHFQFPASLPMEHRWLCQDRCSPWLTKYEWKCLNFSYFFVHFTCKMQQWILWY